MQLRRLIVASAFLATAFAGCSEDPGLQERVNRLQAEIQEKNRQLLETQETLEKTQSELKITRAAANKAPR